MSSDSRGGAPGEAPRLGRRWSLALFLLAVLTYLNGLPAGFTYDDNLIIRDNARLSSPSKVDEIFSTHYFGGSMAIGTAYRPLVLLSYAVQRWVHGNQAPLFRAVNVALHAATTLLLARYLLALGFVRGTVLAATALFAVSTIHVEAVTGLVGRAEVLAAFLVLLAALLWLRATEGERVAARPLAGSLAAFLAAVFVKENAIVVPGVIFLGELFRGGRFTWPGPRLRRCRSDSAAPASSRSAGAWRPADGR